MYEEKVGIYRRQVWCETTPANLMMNQKCYGRMCLSVYPEISNIFQAVAYDQLEPATKWKHKGLKKLDNVGKHKELLAESKRFTRYYEGEKQIKS